MSSQADVLSPESKTHTAQKGSTNANGFTDYFDLDGLLTEENLLVRQSIRDFVKKEILPNIEKWAQNNHFETSMVRKFGEAGAFGPTIPMEYGGGGLDYISYGLIMQEIERGDSGMRSTASVQGSLVMFPIYQYGSEEQRQKFLPKLASGEWLGCFGLTEPDHGSNPAGMTTTSNTMCLRVFVNAYYNLPREIMFSSFLAVVLCVSAVSVNAADRCPGASPVESQEDFKWKYDSAPIVAYGMVSAVRNNIATFQIRCVIKGQLSLPSLDLPQLAEANNKTECHYLTSEKSYVVFLQTMKTPAPDSKTMYVLANMEEIEINADTMNKFMNDECDDEDDFGIDMTMFYSDNANLKCGQLTATCNEMNKPSIFALTYAPLSKSTTFLGGFKKVLEAPKMSSNDDDVISGKQNADDKYRGAATMGMAWMPLIMAITGLAMIFNH